MRAGDVIAGRYEIEAPARQGGMGAVFRARDHARRAPVAVKILRSGAETDLGRFEREARVLSGLTHPGIVRYVDHGVTEDGEPFLVMAWLEGETLSERLATVGLSPAEAVGVVRWIADALGEAHRHGIVHRDVKPDNLVFPHDALGQITLIDFGLARRELESVRLTRTGIMVGTPGYMAPEQARGERVDPRADVFALGCVLHECLTGAPPFAGPTQTAVWVKVLFCEAPPLAQRCPESTPMLVDVVTRMMARAAADRFADGAEVATALAVPGLARPGGQRRRRCEAIETPPTRTAFANATFACLVLIDGADGALVPEDLVAATGLGVQRLADGGLVAITGSGTPIEQAELAVRAARAIAAAAPGCSIAIAAVPGAFEDAIDRAAALLATLGIERAAGAAPAAIVLDGVAAGLLGAGAGVRIEGSRHVLR